MYALRNLAVEEERQSAEDERQAELMLKDLLDSAKNDKKDIDLKELESLVKLAIAKHSKEKNNDE